MCYPIKHMKTVSQIRRDNLVLLIQMHGSLATLNDLVGLPRTDATLSQVKNQSTTSRGNPKMMGDALARRIETELALPLGWMDNDQSPPTERQQRIDLAVRAMEQMGEYQLDQAIKIISTLAEPTPNKTNGTTG